MCREGSASRASDVQTFFLNDKNWNLSFIIYVHALTVLIFGKSVFITRATSVIVGMLGAAAIGLTLKLSFNSRLWWTGVLMMAAIPVWFLHSRTAFETAMMVGFYACFLCCYLLYHFCDRETRADRTLSGRAARLLFCAHAL